MLELDTNTVRHLSNELYAEMRHKPWKEQILGATAESPFKILGAHSTRSGKQATVYSFRSFVTTPNKPLGISHYAIHFDSFMWGEMLGNLDPVKRDRLQNALVNSPYTTLWWSRSGGFKPNTNAAPGLLETVGTLVRALDGYGVVVPVEERELVPA